MASEYVLRPLTALNRHARRALQAEQVRLNRIAPRPALADVLEARYRLGTRGIETEVFELDPED